MTCANETGPQGEGTTSVALSAPGADLSGLFAEPKAQADPAPRTLRSLFLDYSAHAAMIVGLLGFAWTISTHVVSHPAAPAPEKAAQNAPPPAPKMDEVADLRRANQQMADEIRRLRSSVETLRVTVADDKTSAQVRILQAGLDSVRHDNTAGIAQLNGKVDKLDKEPAAKIQALTDRLGKLERQSVDAGPTGSIAPAKTATVVPTPPAKPATVKIATEEPAKTPDGRKPGDDAAAKPQVIAGYVVRDVYDGVALIESRRGSLEVVPGVSIPGAGVVKSIDRQGKGWTVTTTKGLVAFAAPPKDYRRTSPYGRDIYPEYRNF